MNTPTKSPSDQDSNPALDRAQLGREAASGPGPGLTTSALNDEKDSWISYEDGDVRILARERDGSIFVSVEVAGAPLYGARVLIARADGNAIEGLRRPLRTNDRGEVCLGTLTGLGEGFDEIDLLLTITLPDQRPSRRQRGNRDRRPGVQRHD